MGILRRSSNHAVYRVWDEVENDPAVPEGARLAATSAARALYLFGIGGGAFGLALGSMVGVRIVLALEMTAETKLGALLTFAPALLAAFAVWTAMRAAQTRVLQAALHRRITAGASSSASPSSTAGVRT